MKTIVICSGGLDSVTLAYKVAKERTLSALLSFDYGQRHKKELDFAATAAKNLGVAHHIIDISNVGEMLTGSALTDNIDVPDGHYTQDNMKVTIVPNRNAIMLSIAYGVATSMQVESVATAVHAGDHFIYPDCRPEFIEAFDRMQKCALEGVSDLELYAPYIDKTKADIAKDAGLFSVPIHETWSCYKGEEMHCGTCGTCVERIEALNLANAEDTTQYEDSKYWKKAVKEAS